VSDNVWFTSDSHFGHGNVIEYSNRPFDDANEMDEAMIANWNACVRPGDRVYHLGDFSFHKPEKTLKILARLQGQKYLVFGNHDKYHRKDDAFLGHWVWTKELADVKVGDQRIVLCHYAMLTWNQSHRGAWQLHGHSHGSLKPDAHALRADVGVDCWNYYPVSFDEIAKRMSKKDYQPVDHHGEES
jgi:calcineurin-like phosphoesterase family protein